MMTCAARARGSRRDRWLWWRQEGPRGRWRIKWRGSISEKRSTSRSAHVWRYPDLPSHRPVSCFCGSVMGKFAKTFVHTQPLFCSRSQLPRHFGVYQHHVGTLGPIGVDRMGVPVGSPFHPEKGLPVVRCNSLAFQIHTRHFALGIRIADLSRYEEVCANPRPDLLAIRPRPGA
jgi:hypothetical protein